jgi:hypothetical protein
VSTTPNTGRRWALSPVDSRSHLLAEAEGAPVGMVVTECGRLLPCSVEVSAHPPTGLWCPTCFRGAGQAGVQRPLSDADLVAVVSPELVASLVLRLACDGGVAKVRDRYVDGGFPTPGYLAGVFDGLINAGLLTLAEEDPYGIQRVGVTEVGRARYAQLRDTRQPAGLWVPEPRFPTTRPTATSRPSNTLKPAASTAPDPVRGSGPAMHWMRCPTDGRLHAIAPTDTEQAVARGYAEALCGHRLSAEGLAVQDVPSGALCLPCVIGVTADMEDPGPMGTAQ